MENSELEILRNNYTDALKTIEKLTIENVKLEAYALDSVDEKIHLERVGELKKYNESALKMLEEMAEVLDQICFCPMTEMTNQEKCKVCDARDKYRKWKEGAE